MFSSDYNQNIIILGLAETLPNVETPIQMYKYSLPNLILTAYFFLIVIETCQSRFQFSASLMEAAAHSKESVDSVTVKATTQNFGEKRILVTGGAGFIATHTIICLLEAGYSVTVVDNLVNSSPEGN